MSESVLAYILAHGGETETRHYEPTGRDSPTQSMPGSRAKIGILRHRVEHGQELFDPEDLACFDD